VADDLSTPLGQGDRKKRTFVVPAIVGRAIAAALALVLVLFGLWVALIDDPFGGPQVVACRALVPDVALVHASRADRAGNVACDPSIRWPDLGIMPKAAKKVLVTVEEIVEEFGPRSANAVILPHWTVDAITCVPGGAHPSYAHGYYGRDNAYYIAWDAISRDRDSFLAWMRANVLERGPEVFADHARRPDAE